MRNESMQKTQQSETEKAFAPTPDIQSKLGALDAVATRLERAGVDYVIGGSGMLLGLGLAETVRDWDLMTEAPEAEVRAALSDLEVTADSGGSELYGSGSKLTVEGLEPEVEVIVGFAIRSGQGICRLPAWSGGVRLGLRIASPEIWFAAYALMGRTDKAALLETYLRGHGANAAAVKRLLEEPLPQELAQRLDRLPIAES